MKKSLFFFLFGTIICLLVGCDPQVYRFDSNEMLEKVISVQLVECENNEPKEIVVNDTTIPSFDMNSVRLVKELTTDKVEDFLYELSTVTFHVENESVNSPVGYAVLIYTEDEEIIVLSCTVLDGVGYSMVDTFTIEGEFVEHIARFADAPKFRRILSQYFELSDY